MKQRVGRLLALIAKALRRGSSPPSSAPPPVIHLPPLSGPEAPGTATKIGGGTASFIVGNVASMEWKDIVEAAIQKYLDMQRRAEARADKKEVKAQLSELQRQISELKDQLSRNNAGMVHEAADASGHSVEWGLVALAGLFVYIVYRIISDPKERSDDQ